MPTSGTAVFNPEFRELVEEAFERAGMELRTGYDLQTARRSMNFMALEWQNRGINLWTVEQGSQVLTAGTFTYTMPADTIDLLEHQLRTDAGSTSGQTDYTLSRISVSDYAQLSNKLTQGMPLQIYVDRQRAAPIVYLWPVPDNTQTYTLVYWKMRRIQDVGSGGTNNIDVPARFLTCLVAGLAYYVAMKRPEAANRLGLLKQEYDLQWDLAAGEDREKASVRFVPMNGYIGRNV
jgi:hypothetical protein